MKPRRQVVAFFGTTGNISLIEIENVFWELANFQPDNIFSSVLGRLANFQKLQMKAWQQFFVTTGTVGTGLGREQRHKPKKGGTRVLTNRSRWRSR